jgi:hypothetical protein
MRLPRRAAASRRLCAVALLVGLAARNDLESECSTQRENSHSPGSNSRSQTRKLPGHTHTDGCVADTQTFHRQMVGGEAITDRAAAIAAANPVPSARAPSPRPPAAEGSQLPHASRGRRRASSRQCRSPPEAASETRPMGLGEGAPRGSRNDARDVQLAAVRPCG